MQWTKRIFFAIIAALTFSVIMLLIVCNFDRYMVNASTDWVLSPIIAAKHVFQVSRATQLWLLSVSFGLVCIISSIICSTSISVQSGVQTIAPGIRIPKSFGQGQHGTAHFLSKKKYSTVWSYITIKRDPVIQDLINQAKQELDQEGLNEE